MYCICSYWSNERNDLGFAAPRNALVEDPRKGSVVGTGLEEEKSPLHWTNLIFDPKRAKWKYGHTMREISEQFLLDSKEKKYRFRLLFFVFVRKRLLYWQ